MTSTDEALQFARSLALRLHPDIKISRLDITNLTSQTVVDVYSESKYAHRYEFNWPGQTYQINFCVSK